MPSSLRKSSPSSQLASPDSKMPILYIVVASLVVFSMIFAALSAVDFGGLFSDPEPTPDYNLSQVDAQRAIVDGSPENASARALLADLLIGSGQVEEGIKHYEQVLKLDPENAEYRLNLARALQTNGLAKDAEAQFLKVLELEPENHTAHYYLGRLYLAWSPPRTAEGLRHLQKVVELAPNSFLAEQARSILDTQRLGTPAATAVSTP